MYFFHEILYLFISFTLSRNLNAVLLSLADLLCFHISVDYIFIHRVFSLWSNIFLPPLACGFTLPQGDSRWGFSISYPNPIRRRTFPAKHPLYKPLAPTFPSVTITISWHGLAFFQHRSSHCFFCFRTTQRILSNYCFGREL